MSGLILYMWSAIAGSSCCVRVSHADAIITLFGGTSSGHSRHQKAAVSLVFFHLKKEDEISLIIFFLYVLLWFNLIQTEKQLSQNNSLFNKYAKKWLFKKLADVTVLKSYFGRIDKIPDCKTKLLTIFWCLNNISRNQSLTTTQ